MLKVASYDIVFQEVPGEVSLALNLSGCPCHCPGCHSPHLAEDIGEELNEELVADLMEKYGKQITCVCFMGGDHLPQEVAYWADFVKNYQSSILHSPLRMAWYSGRTNMPSIDGPFDFVKIGPYIEELGALKSEKTNQRFYERVEGEWIDSTYKFRKKNFLD